MKNRHIFHQIHEVEDGTNVKLVAILNELVENTLDLQQQIEDLKEALKALATLVGRHD